MASPPTPQHTLAMPEAVERFAARHGLGDPVDIRHERSTGVAVGIGVAVFAVGLVGSLLLSAYNSAHTAAAYSGHGGTAHTFFAPTGAIALIGLGIAIRGLLIGTRTHYLFTGGLIYRRRRGLQALSWSQVTALHTTYGKDRGHVVGYRVDGPDRISVLVPLKHPDGRHDPFVDELLALAAHHHRPIH